ncbi:HAD-IC family P-type ATPase [Cellulomonas hominis]
MDQSAVPAADVAEVHGLTAAAVAALVAAARTNATDDSSSRSIGEILRGNLFTVFNAILFTALVVVLAVGAWQDALFGGVLVVNLLIGVVGEYRAKRVLDGLAILHAAPAVVVRDGLRTEVAPADIVLGDVLRLSPGDQVPADAEVLRSSGLEIDESMLTGESVPVPKAVGDAVLSGSAVLAGSAYARVTVVGEASYANRLTASARRFSLVTSELQAGLTRVLVVMTWVILPLSVLLLWSQVRTHGGWATAWADGTWREAVVAAVAGVIGMVPEGLVLLVSLNFALAAVLLARRQVLVQELPAVEVLARVDVVCFDKTGTLTDGTVVLDRLEELLAAPGARAALAAVAADQDANATVRAMGAGVADHEPAPVLAAVPFSSERKWSAVTTADGTWVVGAPEVVLAGRGDPSAADALARVGELTATGARVVLLACTAAMPGGPGGSGAPGAPGGQGADRPTLPADLTPVLLAVLRERVRPDAAQTLAYFRAQGVDVKVISGDNPTTVAAIATAAGVGGDAGDGTPTVVVGVDARTLPEDRDALGEVLAHAQVFGRVTPEQKRAMVHALQARGHVVAMTGDGVNDALALKDADLGIAMGSGAPATKAVSRLVLLDGSFASLPGVVAQGRRVIANTERVASLFLAKTTYSALLVIATVLLTQPYPFLPRHLTLISGLTIGIPAFVLALAPNDRRYVSGFLRRVLRFAVPVGVVAAAVGLGVFTVVHRAPGADQIEARTTATLAVLALGLWVVALVARPWNAWRLGLVVALAVAAAGAFLLGFSQDFFQLAPLDGGDLTVVLVAVVCGGAALSGLDVWSRRRKRD